MFSYGNDLHGISVLDCCYKGSSGSSFRSPVIDEESTRPVVDEERMRGKGGV